MGGESESMVSRVDLQGSREAARATGRCYGALFFSIFGALWLSLADYAFAHLRAFVIGAIAAGTAGFVVSAVRLLRRAGRAGEGAYAEAERKRNDTLFYSINAVQGVLIFVVLSTLPRMGYQDLAVAVAAMIVGLHFLVMPPLYRSRANLVTGWAMTLWAIGCALLLHGDRMIGWVALGSGLLLWASAVSALKTARGLLRAAGQQA